MSECFFNASICVCFNSLKQSCLQVNQKLKLRLVTCHSSFVSHMHTPYTHCTSLSFSLSLIYSSLSFQARKCLENAVKHDKTFEKASIALCHSLTQNVTTISKAIEMLVSHCSVVYAKTCLHTVIFSLCCNDCYLIFVFFQTITYFIIRDFMKFI